ncbi:MAG TPA: hypothetical protein VKB19_07680 [Pedobacter sp.]|nr:hypothetical protein [Pedobacter sp.]
MDPPVHPVDVPGVKEIRSLYNQSVTSRDAAMRLQQSLLRVDGDDDPLMVCYQGVAEMIQAKYVFSPISKIRSFKKGKALIEQAISRDVDGVEIRYLRFTIQTNLPRFLGYYNEVELDKKFLIAKTAALDDKQLKQQIIDYLSASVYCTDIEKKQIKVL